MGVGTSGHRFWMQCPPSQLDRARSVLRGADGEGSPDHNHFHLEADHLGRKVGQPFRLTLGIPVYDGDAPARLAVPRQAGQRGR